MPQISPFGSWTSPLSAELCTAAQNGVGQLVVNDGILHIVESRPEEGGRNVLLRFDGTDWLEVLPQNFNLRTRLHEYGGLGYGVAGDLVVAVNDADQRLYRFDGNSLEAISPDEPATWRFAEPQIHETGQYVIAIAERHRDDHEPINCIVRLPIAGGKLEVIAKGADFYAYPRISPDGNSLLFLSWNHPQMPWDGTELWRIDLRADGSIGTPAKLCGGVGESIVQPEYWADGRFAYLSDRSGYWNLYDQDHQALWPIDADCGGPLWQLGARWFTPSSNRGALVTKVSNNHWQLHLISNGESREFDLPFCDISAVYSDGKSAWFRAASSDDVASIVELELATGNYRTLYRAGRLPISPAYISRPQALTFTSQGRETFAQYYPPANVDFSAPAGEKPPVIVLGHGGPTSAASIALRLDRQFWTSRGFAICDVDYGGSTGYGRPYRERLKENWGIVDVADCVAAGEHLVAQGLADPDRLIIRGGSAGGFTVLAALTFYDTFKAGASAYGIGDLELLAGDTHKFESRYLDSLIGPYPQCRDIYRNRSPIHHIDRLNTPVIFFQGLDDLVVPPNQAETMVAALRTKGVPVAYLAFEGEGHGFRKAETQNRVLLSELAFYAAIFGIEPAEKLPELEIENWPPN